MKDMFIRRSAAVSQFFDSTDIVFNPLWITMLPDDVVSAGTISTFKERLDIWMDRYGH